MKLIISDDATCRLCFDSVGDRVEVFYFSAFDSSAFESDQVTLSFKADLFFEQLERFIQTGELYICDAGQSFSIRRRGEAWRIDLNAPAQSHSILGISIDMQSIAGFMNN